jgi:hypothetical protein
LSDCLLYNFTFNMIFIFNMISMHSKPFQFLKHQSPTFHYRIAQQILALCLQELSSILNESQMHLLLYDQESKLGVPFAFHSFLKSFR